MTLARLTGGPLDGQVLPLDESIDDTLIVPFAEGQLVYRRVGELENTGDDDGPTEAHFTYAESTEPLAPTAGELDDVDNA
ncbi:response regulator [Microbacterium caowuchunii]|uniref:Response regulator n=1 Tax=Microbacterium caowuchunii TaxID=2614638 RepID=A0A5J6KX25_9MICO|nr:response regulator [Microbacterium caowuchunii]KAA9135933.1 response regulator [Microbacterium caowuchunii]QEW00315.1 response regulator [Microbacterium caowuchunii]